MGIKNLARVVLPRQTHRYLRNQIYAKIPIARRMGQDYWKLRAFLNEGQWWDRERIEIWQLKKLRSIIRYAYEQVPGYFELYRDAGVKPDDVKTLQDIRILPFTSKDLLRENPNEFSARSIPSWRRRYVTTGGSTGSPFGFYHSDTNYWMENAFIHSGWERTGWKLGDLSAVLRGNFQGTKNKVWDYGPANHELLLSSYFLTESTYPQYKVILQKYAPKYIQAYPSAITLLADLIKQNADTKQISFEAVFLGSENIYNWQKVKLKDTFPDAKIHGWYGHTEQVILASMCEYSDQYHIWPFYGLTEILNEQNEAVPEEEIGELVGTSFWCDATPFIRYRTDDLAQRGKQSCCKCKRNFDLIKQIEGRKQDFVVTVDGGYVTLTGLIFAQHFHAFGAVKNMQLFQDKIGEVIVRIVPTDKFTEYDSNEIKAKMETAVGGRLKVSVEYVNDIPRTQRGKFRFLEQKLDIKYGG